jgi:hypothetical protein
VEDLSGSNGDAFQEDRLMTIATKPRTKSSEIYRHRRRGTLYAVVGRAVLQTNRPLSDDQEVVVYKGVDGHLWARPIDEFYDGRFQRAEGSDSRTQQLAEGRGGASKHLTEGEV